jgi:hypothetical protein
MWNFGSFKAFSKSPLNGLFNSGYCPGPGWCLEFFATTSGRFDYPIEFFLRLSVLDHVGL